MLSRKLIQSADFEAKSFVPLQRRASSLDAMYVHNMAFGIHQIIKFKNEISRYLFILSVIPIVIVLDKLLNKKKKVLLSARGPR